MNLALTEEQVLIQSSALDWLAGNYDFRQREASLHKDGGSSAVWSAFAEMGWLGLPLPEADGGLGLGPMEAGLLAQAFGRHLVVEPWHACIVQAGRLLALAGTPAQRATWMLGVPAGEARLALAHTEPGDRVPWTQRKTRAEQTASGWRIHGEKRQIMAAPGASCWLVTASVAGGTGIFLVDPLASGVYMDAYDTSVGGRAADARFDNVPAQACLVDSEDGEATALLHQVITEGIVNRGWEATGTMQAALAQTMAYTQQRMQFGQSLSQFQVVQHRLAEMAVHCAEAQAACELAAMRVAIEPASGVSMAGMLKTKLTPAARFVAQEAVQLHGAMGVCEELPVAAMFRALLAFSQQDGDAPSHGSWLGHGLLHSGDFAHSQTLRATPGLMESTA